MTNEAFPGKEMWGSGNLLFGLHAKGPDFLVIKRGFGGRGVERTILNTFILKEDSFISVKWAEPF